jgi:CO/xanthine dehydrogenase Mo-binding subunit
MADEHRFIDEITRPGMLHLGIVRSDIPRGEVEAVSLPEEMPESSLAISAQDIPGENSLRVFDEAMPVLSAGEVEYIGEPILLIATPTAAELPSLIRDIRISYSTNYTVLSFDPYDEEQVADRVSLSRGNVEDSPDYQHQIVEAEYATSPESHMNRAPVGAFAYREGERMIIYAPTHWPFHVRASVAEVLGIEQEQVRVVQCYASPAYGEKVLFPSLMAVYAALAVHFSGKPARILLNPAETRNYTTKKAPMFIKRTTVIGEEGSIESERVNIRVDVGAYPLFTRELLTRAVISAAGYYKLPNMEITAEAIRTSGPPMNLYRGLGFGQSMFATETHFSRLAELSQRNPGEWKREFAGAGELPTGAEPRTRPLPRLLEQVMEESDFHRKHAAYEQLKKRRSSLKTARRYLRGVGIAGGFVGNGFTGKPDPKSSWSVQVKLDRKDQLSIMVGDVMVPEGIRNLWRRRAEEILGIKAASIDIYRGDTDTLPNSGPMMLSIPITVYTNLVERCCMQIKKERFNRPLPIEVKRSILTPKKSVWNPQTLHGTPFQGYSWGAVVVEVELDPLTMYPETRGVWGCFDCGHIHNPRYLSSVAKTSVYEALAWTIGQERLQPHYHQEYTLEADEQLFLRMPPVNIYFEDNPRGIPGGITSLPESLVPSAFASALTQATGFYFDRIPITPELIHSYMEET